MPADQQPLPPNLREALDTMVQSALPDRSDIPEVVQRAVAAEMESALRALLAAGWHINPSPSQLQRRLDAAKERARDIKEIHTLWTYGRDVRPIKRIMDDIEHIAFSIGCYCDGVPGQYLPSAPVGAADER